MAATTAWPSAAVAPPASDWSAAEASGTPLSSHSSMQSRLTLDGGPQWMAPTPP